MHYKEGGLRTAIPTAASDKETRSTFLTLGFISALGLELMTGAMS